LPRPPGTRPLVATLPGGQRRLRPIRIAAGILLGVAGAPPGRGAAAETRAAAGSPCPPAADVQGPSEIVQPIVAILRGHGLISEPGGCGDRMVKASLTMDPDARGYRLHVRDAVGHTSDRRVADAATAASLIESWALAEDADLWAAPVAPGIRTEDSDRREPPATPSEPPGTAAAAAHIGLGAEVSFSSDDALWWGARATGCARLGALCLGVRAGFARTDTTRVYDWNPDTDVHSDLRRTQVDVSLLVAWSIRVGRLWAAPSLGLGGAWLRSRASLAQLSATTDDFLGRAEVGAAAGVTIHGGWSLAADLGGAVGAVLGGDGREGATATYMPAAPRAFFRAGVGVWYAP